MEHIRKAVLLLLGVAAGVRIAWALLAPAVPLLVSLAVALTVLWIAIVGRHSKLGTTPQIRGKKRLDCCIHATENDSKGVSAKPGGS
jgi:hypothetical protein